MIDPPARPPTAPRRQSPQGRAFTEWLRAQLRVKKMSQRQLAEASGVAHSTISRLLSGDRMPSLGVATKLARGLREIDPPDEGPQYLGLLGGATGNPTARVEYALRADDALSEPQVRQTMEYYLAVRMRRLVRTGGSVSFASPSSPSPQPWSGYERLPAAIADAFRAEPNPHSRRRLIDVYGLDRYVEAVGTVIDSDVDGAGRPRRLWRASRPRDADLVVVEVTNATPEPDGSFHRHWLRVPPTLATAQAAVAWTFGLPPASYWHLVET